MTYRGELLAIVVLSPHRDDAAFSLALTLREWLRQGHRLTVMNCFTRSTYAPFADVSHVHANDLISFVSALRQREDEAWRRQGTTAGLEFADLHLKDAPLRLRCSLPDVCSMPIESADRAADRINEALEKLPGAAVVAPLALGAHVDHRVASEAVLAAAPARALAFYEDLPYAAWPDVTAGIDAHIREIEGRLGVSLHPTTVVHRAPIQEAVALKLAAALCYDSQIETDTAELIARFCMRYGGGERLWATPAWIGLEPSLSKAFQASIR